MAFTVEDFPDLIKLLAQHPEWRAELRRHVLSDDLLELPALVRQLVEAQARTETRLRELAEAQARTELRIGELAMSQRRLEDRQGTMDGRLLELDYARQAPVYFSSIALRLRVIDAGSLANLLDEAVSTGQLTEDEREVILRADLVLSGRRRADGQDVYLLAELSVGVGEHDVERAVERARLLEKLGRPVLPVVAGDWINDEATQLAREQGVWCARGGRVTAPRSA